MRASAPPLTVKNAQKRLFLTANTHEIKNKIAPRVIIIYFKIYSYSWRLFVMKRLFTQAHRALTAPLYSIGFWAGFARRQFDSNPAPMKFDLTNPSTSFISANAADAAVSVAAPALSDLLFVKVIMPWISISLVYCLCFADPVEPIKQGYRDTRGYRAPTSAPAA